MRASWGGLGLLLLASQVSCFSLLPSSFTSMRALQLSQSASPRSPAMGVSVKMDASDSGKKRWQDLAERLADPFVSPFDKPAIAAELAQMAPSIAETLQDVASGKVAAEDALLGEQGKMQLRGARAVQRQLKEDIIPDAQSQVRMALERLQVSGPPQMDASVLAEAIRERLDDATADGRLPQISLPSPEEIQMELRNVFQSTPEGLEAPAYAVIERCDDFEVREYEKMVVAKTPMDTSPTAGVQGQEFTTLAGFLFGDNDQREAMKMTMPVITNVREDGSSTAMAFVIPAKNARDGPASTPKPTSKSKDVTLEEVAPARVAARTFPGFATRQESLQIPWLTFAADLFERFSDEFGTEVTRQRTALIAALERAGWTRPAGQIEAAVLTKGCPEQVTLLQYNPPYTIPTVRRNEVVVKLQGWGAPADWASADTPADEDVAAQEASTPPRQRGFDNDDWKSGGVAVAAPAAAPAPEKPPTSSLPEDQVSSTDARPEPSSPRPDYSQYRLLSDAAAEASATEVEQTAQDAGKTKSGKGRGKKGKKK